MFYTIYKITNQINGKIYIGSHKTKDLDDSYMGSGKYLKYAQDKYGIENFKKEILFVFETAEEMYAKEAQLVNEDFLAEENTYNLKVGGFGGFNYLNDIDKFINPTHTSNFGKYRNLKMKELYPCGPFLGKTHSAKTRKKISKTLDEQYENGRKGSFLGKTHSTKTKKKISDSAKLTSSGEKNSQYGTRWIHSFELKISKKIKKEEPLPDGWLEGRKLKF